MYSRAYNRTHARAVIADLRASGRAPTKRRVGRIPKPQPPTQIANAYAAAIRLHVNEQARAAFERHAQAAVLSALVDLRRHMGRMDAAPEPRRSVEDALRALVECAARLAGLPRRTPSLVLRPTLATTIGDVRGASAFYDDRRDEITIGAVPLALWRALLDRGRRAETDSDLLAVKVAVHEGLHASVRRGGVAGQGDEERAQIAVEEATAEIAAQLLTLDAARAVGIDVDDALATRWQAPLFRAVDGDVRLARPTSYPAFVERIGRLAARAEVPGLLAWTLALRRLKAGQRLDALAKAVGVPRDRIVVYLAAPRTGTEAPLVEPSQTPWIARGDVQPGEMDADMRAVILRAEAAIVGASTAREIAEAVALVDALHDVRASFHARTAIEQRVGSGRQARADSGAPLKERVIEDLAGRIGRKAAEAAVDVAGEAIVAAALATGIGEVVATLLLVAAEIGLPIAGEKAGRALARKAMRRDADEDEERNAGRNLGMAAIRRLRALAEQGDEKQREREASRSAREFGADLDHAAEQGKRAAEAIDRAAREFADHFRPDALYRVVEQFGKRTDDHARRQLDQQLRQAIGIPLSAIEKPMRDSLSDWADANVDLIKTIPERYFDRLRADVLDAFRDATAPRVLADRIADAYGVSESNAERIARDQTLSLAADLHHARMESLGVEEATWQTMNDGRVCPLCAPMQGKRFKLTEGTDGPCGPGSLPGGCHPQDRCYSAPVLDDLIR